MPWHQVLALTLGRGRFACRADLPPLRQQISHAFHGSNILNDFKEHMRPGQDRVRPIKLIRKGRTRHDGHGPLK